MKEDTKQVLYATAFPTFIMGLTLIIGGMIMAIANGMLGAEGLVTVSAKLQGLVLVAFAGTLMIGGVLYWDVATQIRLFRKDINDIKKLP